MFITSVLADLGRRRFTNVLVEGGAGLLGSFRDADAIDECHVFIAPVLFGGAAAPSPVGGVGIGPIADALALDALHAEISGPDVYLRGRRRR